MAGPVGLDRARPPSREVDVEDTPAQLCDHRERGADGQSVSARSPFRTTAALEASRPTARNASSHVGNSRTRTGIPSRSSQASAKSTRTGAPLARPVEAAQRDIAWAEHLAIFFPLWLGDMPALLKGFFEQVLRPGFAIGKPGRAGVPKKLLKGRSARIVVTMGMPALFYSVYYRAHSVKSLKRNMLEFCGVAPVRTTLIGMVERGREAREDWLLRLAVLGNAAG